MYDEYTPAEGRREDTKSERGPGWAVDYRQHTLCSAKTLEWLAKRSDKSSRASEIARAARAALTAAHDADAGIWGAAAWQATVGVRRSINRLAKGRRWHGDRSAIRRRAHWAGDQMHAFNPVAPRVMHRLGHRLWPVALRAAVREGLIRPVKDRWEAIDV